MKESDKIISDSNYLYLINIKRIIISIDYDKLAQYQRNKIT